MLNDLKHQFDDNSKRQDELHADFDLQVIQDNVKVAALQAEEKAESVTEDFLDGRLVVRTSFSIAWNNRMCHISFGFQFGDLVRIDLNQRVTIFFLILF